MPLRTTCGLASRNRSSRAVADQVPRRVGPVAEHPAQGGEGEEARLARVAAAPPAVAKGGAPHAGHAGYLPAVARIVVVGSVNLDLVARVPRLPEPGETPRRPRAAPGARRQGGPTRRWPPGGSAPRVALIAAVGTDPAADEALALLRDEGVDLAGGDRAPRAAHRARASSRSTTTGETTIVVAAGANDAVGDGRAGAAPTPCSPCWRCPTWPSRPPRPGRTGMFVLNAAPARPVAPDVLRAGRPGRRQPGRVRRARRPGRGAGRSAVTLGGEGAELRRGGAVVARAVPPPTTVVDGTGAGDCFTAGAHRRPARPAAPTRTPCATPAPRASLAVSRPGAQPALP